MNLYNLLQASLSDPNSPNILLTVSLADLHQLVVDTIDATRERLLPPLHGGRAGQVNHQERSCRTTRRL